MSHLILEKSIEEMGITSLMNQEHVSVFKTRIEQVLKEVYPEFQNRVVVAAPGSSRGRRGRTNRANTRGRGRNWSISEYVDSYEVYPVVAEVDLSRFNIGNDRSEDKNSSDEDFFNE